MYGLHDQNGVLIQKQPQEAEGFIDIPESAVCGMVRDSETGEYSLPDPIAPTVEQVKAETQRRILDFCPDWKQRNLTALSVRLNRKSLVVPPVITPTEQDQLDFADAVFDHIDAIRTASDVLEGTLPVDYTDDSHWPADPGLDLTDK